MEFLVRLQVRMPPDHDADARAALIAAEAARGRELLESGALRRIWRLPGQWANFSLYDVADATVLHELLASLPLWPWLSIEVQALATHPLEEHPSRAGTGIVCGE